ncbi:UDP-glucose,sterol transferase [Colletotrichum orchidophilum]|uniref:UDP-glucose,sterol transferase n=1 Tax=Colletotrichum orchidophilum TaxID=1209926 RepID=A0A1G4B7A5_9PEZI|nr:UDP-glucose,sterol transferase [Colletotrichum orchidophilum]OHE97338.1 UDP-glucose,sterol transferase [Colletotrichum orchidophilum]
MEQNHTVKAVASAMRQDRGVDTATESFHRNILADNISCNLISGQRAAWLFDKHSGIDIQQIRLSKKVASSLIDSKKIKIADLESLRMREYDADVDRSDPIIGSAFSFLSSVTDFTIALGGTLIDSWKEYKRFRASGQEASRASGAAAIAVSKGFASGHHQGRPRSCKQTSLN